MTDEELDYNLFGDVLIKPSTGEEADPVDVLVDKVLLLYFGAYWNEDCQKFTPKLHLFNQLQENKENYEIIFCSMDRNEEEYKKYSEQMPWWCLPYAISTLPQLVTTYHASKLPHLVVLDDFDGKVITKQGAQNLLADPLGYKFPWRPPPVVMYMPKEYMKSDLTMHEFTELDDKHLMLYFSSKNCGASQDFTPWLGKAYKILKKKRPDDFELIYVSCDETEDDFEEHYAGMPFCAIPYEDRAAKDNLWKRLEVKSTPALLMLGPSPGDGEDRPLINPDVRSVIENGEYISDFPFYPKPYGDLCYTTDDINTHKCLVIFHEEGDPEEQDAIEEIVQMAAQEYIGDELIKFYWAFDPEADMSLNIRQACELGPPTEIPMMVLLDIGDDGAFYISDDQDISVESILNFVVNKGERMEI